MNYFSSIKKLLSPVLLTLYICAIFTLPLLLIAEDLNSQGKIKIGAISVLTGEGASWGINHKRGTQLAVEEVNARGGINGKSIEVIFEDSAGGVARNAVAAYSKLVSINKVKYILGPLTSAEALAVLPIAQRDNVFLGGATYVPVKSNNFFSTWIDPDVESDLLAQYVFKNQKRIAILASQHTWETQTAHRFREMFRKLGGEVVALEEPSYEANDISGEVLKVKQKKPEAILITSYYLLPQYVKKLKEFNINVPIYSIELDQGVIDISGIGAEQIVFIAPSVPLKNFVSKFKVRWNALPDIPAASSYDAALLLLKAISESGEDVARVADFFGSFTRYDGASGRIERVNGKITVSTSFYIVKHGKIETYVSP